MRLLGRKHVVNIGIKGVFEIKFKAKEGKSRHIISYKVEGWREAGGGMEVGLV